MAEDISAELVASLAQASQTNTSVLKELSDLVRELKKILPGKKGALAEQATDKQDKSATDVALESKVQEVTLSDIEQPAFKKLKELFEGSLGKTVPDATKPQQTAKPRGGSKGLLDMLGLDPKSLLEKSGFGKNLASGLLAPLAGLGASLALAVGSWFNDGPWKGTMKEAGKLGTKVFLPKATEAIAKFFPKLFESFTKSISSIGKTAGGLLTKLMPTTGLLGKLASKFFGFLKPFIKRLPIIGTIIDVGSAVSRFMKGDILGGIIDLGSAVASLFPGIGTAISFGLGLINAGRDLTKTDDKKTEPSAVGGIINKVWDWIKDKFKKLFTGWFGKLGRGWEQIKSGDYMRGIVTLASFSPPFFWLEPLYNWLAGPPEKPKEDGGKKEASQPSILSKAWDWIKGKFKSIFSFYFGKLSRGWEQIKSGNVVRGIVTLANFVPGLIWLEPLYNWLAGPPEKPKEEGGQKEKSEPGLLSKAWDWIKGKFKTIFSFYFGKLGRGWDQIKSGDYIRGIVTWASFIPALGWLEPLYNWLVGPPEKPSEEGKEGAGTPTTGILSKAWNTIKQSFKDIFTNWFGKLGRGWDQIKSGNYLQGLITWASFIPGFGWLESLYSFIAKPIDAPKDEAGGGEKFDFDPGKIFGSIKDAVKAKLKGIVESLKKLWWVPNKVINKIASFLGIADEKPKEESVTATAAGTTTAPATTNITTAPVVPPQPVLVATTPQLTPEEQAIQQQRQSAQAAQAAFNNMQPTVAPNVAVPVTTPTEKSNEELVKTLSEKIGNLSKPASSSSSVASTNMVSSADNSSINVYSSGSDRDIPYVERNKYRQQLLYIRGIL